MLRLIYDGHHRRYDNRDATSSICDERRDGSTTSVATVEQSVGCVSACPHVWPITSGTLFRSSLSQGHRSKFTASEGGELS